MMRAVGVGVGVLVCPIIGCGVLVGVQGDTYILLASKACPKDGNKIHISQSDTHWKAGPALIPSTYVHTVNSCVRR